MILNDNEIRKRCVVPTHTVYEAHTDTRVHYADAGNGMFIALRDGKMYSKDFVRHHSPGLKELTPEQQRGYAPGGGEVPVSGVKLIDLEIDGWDGTELEQLKLMENHPETSETNREHYKQIRVRLEKLVEKHAPKWGRMIYPYEPCQVRHVLDHEAMIIDGYSFSDIETLKHYIADPTRAGQHGLYHHALARLEGWQKNPITKKVISYGTSSMGYDVRLGRKFKVFTNVFSETIDPLNMPERAYVDHEGDYVIIPPNSYVLGHTIEYFRMPEDVVAICVGKSTYARAGCAINVTPIEPGFEGQVVIEIANQTPLPMKVYADMGIAQFMFLRGDECATSYAKRAGKYQGQLGIQTALV